MQNEMMTLVLYKRHHLVLPEKILKGQLLSL